MFGQSKPAFSTGTFGQTGGFGTTTPFGGGSTAFGTPGGFGSQTPASTGLFGNTTAQTPATGGIFGGTGNTSFGQTQNTGFGGFGAQTSQAGGLFGSTSSASNVFGTPTTSSAFGTKAPAATGFGATQQTSSLFGSTNTASSSLFGGSAGASTGGGLFGQTSAFGAGGTSVSGTAIKFNPPAGTDTVLKSGVSQSISTRHQCITAMKEYESKSLEELRMEDYGANRKGPQAGAAPGVLFGQSQTQQQTAGFSGGFGQQNKTTGFGGFGTTNNNTGGGIFGQQQPAQQNNTPLFGSTANKPLFGTATTSAGATGGFGGFGTTNTSQAGGGLFGQNQNKGLFGTQTTQQSGGLFGQTQTSTAFGTSGGFGGGFGTTNTQQAQSGGLFGNKPAFGAPTTSTSTLGFGQTTGFNKPATSTTGFNFGQTATTGFGTQQTGGLFGAKPGGFGNTTGTLGGTTGFGNLGTGLGTGTSLFSGQQNKPGIGLGSTFGASTGLGTFGNTTLGGGLGAGTGVTAGLGTTANGATLAAQQAQIQQQLMALANSPYGDSPLFKNLKQEESKRDEQLKPTNPAAQKAALSATNQYKVNSRPTAKIKPKPLQSLNNKSQLFEGLEEEESSFGNDTFVPRKSIKKLVIKSNHNKPLNSSTIISPNKSRVLEEEELVAPSPIMPTTNVASQRSVAEPETPNTNGDAEVIIGGRSINSSAEQTPVHRGPYGRGVLDDTITALGSHSRSDLERSRLNSTGEEDEDAEPAAPHPAGIKLSRPGYYTMPSLDVLATMVDDNRDCWVTDFVIGRDGYGNVFFPGITNIAGLNLDEIVHFRRKEVTVYPDDDKKPTNGEGLNKKAQVTLDCVWPNDKSTHTPIQSPQRLLSMNYQEKIEQASAKIGAKFIDYRPETGSWVFEVRHFSKYGLLDDSDDEGEPLEKDPKKLKLLHDKNQQQLTIQKKRINEEQRPTGKSQLGEQQAQPMSVVEKAAPTTPLYSTEQGLSGEEEDNMVTDIMNERSPEYLDITVEGEDSGDQQQVDHSPASHRIAARLGVNAQDVQVMKASFFGEDEDMDTDRPLGHAATSSGLGGSSRVLGGSSRGLGGSLYALSTTQSSPLLHRPVDVFSKQQPPVAPLSPTTRPAVPKPSSSLHRSFIYERVQMQQPQIRPALKPLQQACPDHILLPSGMTNGNQALRVVGSRIPRVVPALEDSYMANKHHMVMDSALAHGRTCRVGWGPGMTIVHCGKPIMKAHLDILEKPSILPRLVGSQRRRLDDTPYEVVMEKINITGYSSDADPALKNMLEKTLEIQLKHSEMTTEMGSPVFVPTPGVASLHRCAEQAHEDEDRISGHPYSPTVCHTRMVWDLCVALWGHLNHFVTDEDIDKDSHDYHMARREAFSQWLTATATRKIKTEVNDAKIRGDSHLHAVRSYMSGRKISEACAVAQFAGDHRLAMLLAQAAGSAMSRKLLAQQLANWQEHKADALIEEDRLRLYALLAGTMVWPSSISDINVCEDLDWKRCLAIHLWYSCTPTAKVSDALREYDAAFKGASGIGKYACLPLPPYLEDSVDKLYAEEEEERVDKRYVIRDMCYHLIKLYSDKSHRLERILTPTTSTSNHLDLTLSWHLMQVLHGLEFRHLSDHAAASITAGFAAQLEALGLWHWAVFVLLHLEDQTSREHVVRELLGRHVSLSHDADYIDREHFVQERLQVPAMWLHEAKAQRAHMEKRMAEQAWHLIKAGKWNPAHSILLKHVASDAIINERYGYLKRYLREMAPPEHSSCIQDWATGGKVYHDYISMIETLDEIKQGDLNAYELERLQPEVTSLCSRIEHLPCYSAKDRLCQSEMAKRTANLLRMLLMLQQSQMPVSKPGLSACVLAPHIAKLPLPEDYALQELRDLTRAHMLEMTS